MVWRKDGNFGFSVNLYMRNRHSTKPSTPSCSIKYYWIYVAHLCFAHATGNNKWFKKLNEMHKLYIIGMLDDDEDTRVFGKQLVPEKLKVSPIFKRICIPTYVRTYVLYGTILPYRSVLFVSM